MDAEPHVPPPVAVAAEAAREGPWHYGPIGPMAGDVPKPGAPAIPYLYLLFMCGGRGRVFGMCPLSKAPASPDSGE